MRLLLISFSIVILTACSYSPVDDEDEPSVDEDVTEEDTDTENAEENDAETENSEEESKEEPALEPAYDNAGNVDILSPNFHKDYLNHYYYYSYGGIERGMTSDEVAELIGEPSEDDDIPADEIFNDLAVRYSYQADTVEQVLVTPDETITFDEIISAFGEPTQDLSPEDIGSTVRILTYQPADDANFYIAVEGDGDDNVSLIYPSQLTNAEVVNEDNVMDFISAYYDKNVLDMSLINFEDPVFSEADGYFEIPFVNVHHGLTGLFRVWPYGQIDCINENDEYAYGEFIPYADGEIK